MRKIIKLSRKTIKNSRTYKILTVSENILNVRKVKLGSLEYKKSGQHNLYLNINNFLVDFLNGAFITSKLLSTTKSCNLLRSPWGIR
jgi:glycosyltransferase involved in cell wall biosynthesis